jgi:2-dehydro-3-deoxygluconokinase
MHHPKRFAAIGECLIEMSHQDEQHCHLGYAGDTYNVAVYCARSSDPETLRVDYISAVGDDPYSKAMLQTWENEGVHADFARRLKGRMPGLYFIRTDASGEREFYYYRSESAARNMFKNEQGADLLKHLPEFDCLYFSGISIAILDEKSRQQFFDALQLARKKQTMICFDSNYRERLWSSLDEAREVMTQFLSTADIALLSFDDEQALFGEDTPELIAERAHQAGVPEVVVKRGGQGYFLSMPDFTEWVPITPLEKVVDATAAGDSFNGAYLAARMQGLDPKRAAELGSEMTARVIQFPGAIIPK